MRAEALSWLGLAGEDWGPCYTDNFTHDQFSTKWRGSVPCPTEAELIEASALAVSGRDVEIKRHLLAEAMVKRDVLLVHLERLRTRAIEANNTASRDALSTAITSLENSFNDQRVIDAIDGEVKQVLATIKNEIGFALAQASPSTYYALLALDAL